MCMLDVNYMKGVIEVGCDEAGRGCLAGPVVAAAVILPPNFRSDSINDSKQISEKNRDILRKQIEEEALYWSVAYVDNNEIDKINILNASIKAMHLAIGDLEVEPEHIIVDGNKFKNYKEIPHKCIIKGDAKYMSIAAASILAKTHRDEYMQKIDKEFPMYMWWKNKGYPTKHHKSIIQEIGMSKYHRKSFRCIDEQLKFEFK